MSRGASDIFGRSLAVLPIAFSMNSSAKNPTTFCRGVLEESAYVVGTPIVNGSEMPRAHIVLQQCEDIVNALAK
jgi:hypothetical protein